jgi:DNA relaxase NicK
MAKARTKKTSNVIAMPGIESSALALEKATELTDLDIARRAFEIYCERGYQHGHDVDDWVRAERELKGSMDIAVA